MIKRILCLTLCLCMALALLPGSVQADSKIYLALGDSISTGFGLKDAKTEGYTYMLADQLGYELTNCAIDGNTTAGLIQQMAKPEIQAKIARADLITITVGGNDMMGLFYSAVGDIFSTLSGGATQLTLSDIYAILGNPTDTRMTMLMMCAQMVLMGNPTAGTPAFMESETFAAGLTAYATALTGITTAIHMLNPDAKIVVATQYNPFAGFTGMYAALNNGFEMGVQKLNEAIRTNAEAGGYIVADVYDAFANSENYLYNATMDPLFFDTHPNAAGHKVIQETFFSALGN